MKIDARKLLGTIIGISAFAMMVVALTYAYYTWKSEETLVSINIDDSYFYCESGLEKNIDGLYPVLDYRSGGYQTFKVNNIGRQNTTFSLTMNILDIDEELKDESFKYKLVVDRTGGTNNCADTNNNSCVEVGSGNFKNAKVGMNTLVETVNLPNDVRYQYYLFLYIDGNMENDSAMQTSSMTAILEVCEVVVFLDYDFGNVDKEFLKVSGTYAGLPSTATRNNTVITYNSNGGSAASSGTINYTFDGWYTAKDGGGSKVTASTEVTSTTNHTLYANWVDDVAVTLPTTTRTGYTFGGWYSDSSLTNKVGNAGDSYKPETSVTLYAKWTANKYKITTTANGGTITPSTTTPTYDTVFNIKATKTVTVTGNVNGTGATVGSATSKAQTFAGWTSTSGLNTSTAKYGTASNAVTTSWSNGSTKVGSTTTYFKNLTPTSGGTVAMVANWTPVAFNLPTVTKTGHTCTWNTASDGNGTSYASGASYTPSATSAQAITMYARCTANNYTLTVNPSSGYWGGSTSSKTLTKPYGTTIYIPEPTRIGYSFNGWTKSSGLSLTSYGTPSHADSQFLNSLNGMDAYGNNNNEVVTLNKTTESSNPFGGNVIKITTNGAATPGAGGFEQYPAASLANNTYYHVIVAKIPIGYTLTATFNHIWGGTYEWLTSAQGTGNYETYIFKITTGSDKTPNQWGFVPGNPYDFGHMYLYGTDNTSVTWYVAYANMFNATTSTGLVGSGAYTFTNAEHTLTANWQANTYMVTFNANGGSVSTGSKTVTYGSTYGDLPTPTKDGYTFDGWYTETSGGTKVTKDSVVSITSAQTLYARWVPINYTVSLDTNGGSSLSNINYNIETATFKIGTPTKTGYTFSHWKDNQYGLDGTVPSYIQQSSNSNVLTFENTTSGNSYSGLKIQIWNNDNLVSQMAASTSNVSSTYTHTADSGTYYVRFGTNGSTEDNTLWIYANLEKGKTYRYEWKVDSFTDQKAVARDLKFYIEGDSHVGIPQDIIPKGSIGNRSLTAQWTANQYTVSFNANGGSVSPTSKTVTYASTYGDLPTPTRTGYTFDGWYTASSGGTKITSSSTVSITSAQTLYAHWTAQPYTVTFEDNRFKTMNQTTNGITLSYDDSTSYLTLNGTLNGSIRYLVLDSNQNFNVGEQYKVTLTHVSGGITTNDMHAFVTDIRNGTSAISERNYLDIGFPASGSVSDTFTINSAGSSEGNAIENWIWVNSSGALVFNNYVVKVVVTKVQTKTVTYGGTYGTLPTQTKTGYTFNGWYTAPSGGTKITSSSTVSITSNQTLYAQWSASNYSLVKVLDDNLIINGNFETYSTTSAPTATGNGVTHSWDGSLNGIPGDSSNAYFASAWGTGANMGVEVPEIGYHAHMRIVDSNAVFRFKSNEDYSGQTQANVSGGVSIVPGTIYSNRWTGISQAIQGSKLTAGKTYVLTVDIYRVSGSLTVSGGVYYTKTSDTSYNFWSGLSSMSPSRNGVWETLSWTFTLASDYRNTSMPYLYIYGHDGGNGEVYIDNVRLEEATTSTKNYNSAYTTTELADLSRTGYTFNGWYNGYSYSTRLTTSNIFNANTASFDNVLASSTNARVYAKWTVNQYTVSFNANGGSVSTPSKTVTYGSTYGDLPTPTRTGYGFKGWYTAASGGTKIESTTAVSITSNQTLYAQWEVYSYKLNINPNSGYWGGSTSTKTLTKTYGTTIYIPEPTRTGYSFSGWTKSSGLSLTSYGTPSHADSQFLNSLNGMQIYNNIGNVAVTHTKTTDSSSPFGGNVIKITTNGSATPGAGGFHQYTAATYTNNTYYHVIVAKIPVGYSLYEAANSYMGGGPTWVTSTAGTGNYETYILKIETGSDTSPTSWGYYPGQISDFGYMYLNGTDNTSVTWYVAYANMFNATTSTGLVGSGAYTFTNAEHTLTANWVANPYTVSFNANGGTVSTTSKTVTYGSTYGTLPTPERTGYTFNGWFTAASGGTKIESTTTVSITSNQTLYAQWSINSYYFNLNLLNPDGSEPCTSEPGTVQMSVNDGAYTTVYNEPASSYTYGTVLKFKNFSPGTGRYLSSVTGATESSGVWSVTVTSATTVNFYTAWNSYSFNLNVLNPDGSEPYTTGEAGTIQMSVNDGAYTTLYNEPTSSYTYGTVLKFKNFSPGTGRYLSSVTGATESSGVWSVTVTSATTVNFYTAWNSYYFDLNWYLNGSEYSAANANGAILAGLKINGVDQGYISDYFTQHTYGTSWEVYGVRLNGTNISYSASGTIGAGNADHHISVNTVNITSNNTSYGTVSTSSLYVLKNTTFSTSGTTLTFSDGRKVTASAIAATGYGTGLSSWSPSSGTITSATTITANFSRWANTYTVSFNANGGSVSTSSKTVTYASTYGTLPTPTRSGYTFNGWFTASSGGSQVTSSTGVWITSNQTLYAQWTIQFTSQSFSHNGGGQSFTVPISGTYKLEVWGARGGQNANGVNGNYGGNGGYSYGNVTLTAGQVIYIYCGGYVDHSTGIYSNYNGGGASNAWGGPGGGATHIATTNRGVLSNYASYTSEVLIVAGGGGGSGTSGEDYDDDDNVVDEWYGTGGAGGGTTGGNGYKYGGQGGTQTAGGKGGPGWQVSAMAGSFGQGGYSDYIYGGGGGGGWYGGGGSQGDSGGGGGSGYIGGVTSGGMSSGINSGQGRAVITFIG